ncbi:MAG: hypothetical protein HW388_1793 [Dehalococcoidia bacterium]|nr:hypothetical protein [Dehalococcoidia bacterium]
MRLKDPSSRWLAGVALAILALIVLSVAVTLLNRQREAAPLPEDTPEGTVQRFLLAIDAGDSQTAYSYLSSRLQESCTQQNLRDSARWLEEGDLSATIEDTKSTKTLDGQVEVQVRITQFHVSSPPFPPFGGPQESSNTAWYILEKEGEVWRFTAPPWPLGWCPGLERKLEQPVPATPPTVEPY